MYWNTTGIHDSTIYLGHKLKNKKITLFFSSSSASFQFCPFVGKVISMLVASFSFALEVLLAVDLFQNVPPEDFPFLLSLDQITF